MTNSTLQVVELFAGVGGFRLALEGNPKDSNYGKKGFEVVWANQWEPPGTKSRQFAFDCYTKRFDSLGKHPERHINEDVSVVLDLAEKEELEIPDHDLLVGGFPCQDYSVAKPLALANGIEGKKGVLWWEIYRLLKLKQPKYVLLENVDRMLKSPASQRGRDFAIMLSCLAGLDYSVEWRVINAAEYGFPQKRRRVYIYAEKSCSDWDLHNRLMVSGVMAESFPIRQHEEGIVEFAVNPNPYKITKSFGKGDKTSTFLDAGVMQSFKVATKRTEPEYSGTKMTLGDILIREEDIPDDFFINNGMLERWQYLKGSKKEPRKNKRTGYEYIYSEGGMAFPDALSQPARTILTGEGGKSPSRSKHIVMTASGRYRRLVPEELEKLQGFPLGWTDTGMTTINRAFCMGNALVVGVPEKIGQVIKKRLP
ncbi:MAG: DNA (cytosine-5-)-methyltransferase [Coriobacteriia bacterium]|jgi:DNA (cytosine-5)-methyltransferase 1|nr:DNA (cytosine-5-)-methyltransferase [Coriobacteriia bacterium]MDR2714981.1 DNA (cytosine-5-)-methyltransferase [Coriobacteriales bacterium]